MRKAQVNKEVVAAVFFDLENAYDRMWKERILIKLEILGVGGRMYNWLNDLLFGSYGVDNGTLQGSVISPLLFSIMIDDVYATYGNNISRLFADDRTIWKRGWNMQLTVRRVQQPIIEVEEWALCCRLMFSVGTIQTLLIPEKRWKMTYY